MKRVLIAACMAVLGAAPTAAQSPEPTVAAPSPTSAPSPGPRSLSGEGPLQPGTYASTALGFPVTFTLGEEWDHSGEIDGAGFYLAKGGLLTVTTFPGEVFSDPCDPEADEAIDRAARSFIDVLTAHPALTTNGEPTSVEVGGLSGWQLDVTSTLPAECQDPPWIWLWVLPVVGDFHLEDRETARFIALDAGDTVVVIVMEALPDVDWDAFLASAMSVVRSLEIGIHDADGTPQASMALATAAEPSPSG